MILWQIAIVLRLIEILTKTEVKTERSPSNCLESLTSVTTKILGLIGLLHNTEVRAEKISLQLSRIVHICHDQDLDIDWNFAQHWSKSWKISPTVGNLTSVTTIMRSKSQNGVEKCYSNATWERPTWDAPKAVFAAKMQSAKSLCNHKYSTEHCMNSCCKIAAQRI